MLLVYGLSKGCSSGMTEYISLELSGNGTGDNKEGHVCMLPLTLKLPP